VPPPRRRRGLLIGVLAGAAVLLLIVVGATAVVGPRLFRQVAASTAPTASPTVAPPTARPVSTTQYQQLLHDVDEDLGPKVTALGAATRIGGVNDAARLLQEALFTESSKLRDIQPPAPIRPANGHFIDGLYHLSIDIGATIAATEGAVACGGVAALSTFTSGTGASTLRQAVQELATADPSQAYVAGAFLPAAVAQPARQLANGNVIKKASPSGSNQLKVQNQSANDAVMSGAPAGSTTASFLYYVRAGQTATMTGIPNGDFAVSTTTGKDWDAAAKTFTLNCGYTRPSDPLKFAANRSQYTIWTITITNPGSANPTLATNFPT
jgi:hypothetical protein